jgi:hypothetical protein
MTTVTFIADSTNHFVNWNDPARWSTGVVPNDPAIDVFVPLTTVVATGDPYTSYISETGSYAVGSLAINGQNYLLLNGTMTVTHNLNLNDSEISILGGALSADTFDNNGFDVQGHGTINVTGLFLNESLLVSDGGLSVVAGSLTNTGTLLAANGNLNVSVTHGGFTNLAGSTLSGGSYRASNAGLYLDVGNVITTDAANILLDSGGAIYAYDDVAHDYVSIASSLHSIAASGTLSIAKQTSIWTDLTIDGSLIVSDNATLNATQLTINAGGTIKGIGTIGGPILNNGTIVTGPSEPNNTTPLLLTGPVTGSGTIEIGPAYVTFLAGHPAYSSNPVELGAAASSKVVFDDGHGTLRLDDPAEFTGTITPTATGDQIILGGISIDSVTGYSYSGDSNGGTLAIHTTAGETDLHFLGNFATNDFTLAAGPQHLSSDPATLLITNIASEPGKLKFFDFGGDHKADLLWQRDDGTVAVWDSAQSSGGHVTASAGSVPSSWHVAGVADFDGNGRGDVLWRSDDGTVAIWDNGLPSGGHVTAAAGQVPSNWHIAGTDDFDGNGKSDILWQSTDGTVAIWDNGQPSGGHVIASAGTVTSDWHIAGTGDFDGNGKSDILWQKDDGTIGVWDNGQPSGAHFIANAGSVPSSWHFAGIADFDGNGHADILWQKNDGTVAIWDNGQPGGGHVVANAGSVPGNWHIAGTGDFDGNGHADILWRSDDGTVAVWDNGQPGGGHVVANAGVVPSDWHIV